MMEVPNPSSEEAKRLIGFEREQLLKSLNNIRALDPEIFDDGLSWLWIRLAIEKPEFQKEVPLIMVAKKAEQLRLKYPELMDAADENSRSRGNLFHDTVVPQLKRLYQIDGPKIFLDCFGVKYTIHRLVLDLKRN